MKENYTKSVSLYCPVCGSSLFGSVDDIQEPLNEANDDVLLKCSNCSLQLTKGELKEKNQDVINATFEELKEDVISDVKKDFEKMLKDAFKRR